MDSRQPTFAGMRHSQIADSTYWRTLGIYPLKERRSLLMPASGAGGVETSCVIGASSPSACRVLRPRSRAGPPASRELFDCLAIARADGRRSG